MNHNVLNIGAVGCGYWGPNLIRNFVEIPETEVVAIADLLQTRLDHVKRRYPQIQVATQNYRDLFELGLDAVVIATPPQTHFPIARDCLNHGLHVLVEKPITLSSRDACELTQIAERRGLVLMVGHTFEFNPAVHVLKGMIHSGELGEVFYIDAVRASLGLFQTDINIIWDLAPHDISILRYILGTEPLNICSHASACVQKGIEDIAYVTLQFPNNVLAHIRMSWLDPAKTRRITVVGSEKMVIYDDVENLEKIKVYDKGVKAIRRTDTFGEFQFAYHYGDVIIPFIRSEEPLRLECLNFAECIQEGMTPRTDGLSGMRVVQIIEAAQESLNRGGQKVVIKDTLALEPADGG